MRLEAGNFRIYIKIKSKEETELKTDGDIEKYARQLQDMGAVNVLVSMAFGCTLRAPHGGIFVFPVVEHPIQYLLALLVGSVVGMLLLGVPKKKVTKES